MRKSNLSILAVIILSLITNCYSNLWDSIFSNAYSKHYDLPLKGTLKLTDKDEKQEIIDVGIITYNSQDEKLSFNLKKIKISGQYIDFNMITWVDFKTFISYRYQSEACTKDDKNKKMAGVVDLVFLLKSYELMTVYNDADKDYYNYYLINKDTKVTEQNISSAPNLDYAIENKNNFLSLKDYIIELCKEKISELMNSIFLDIISKIESLEHYINIDRNLQSIKFKKDPKDDSNFSFYVDKKDDSIKKIDIKYSLLKLEGLDAKYNSEVDPKELEINPICFKD